MKWIGIALASLAALVALCAAIGAALPKRHVAKRTAVIGKSAAEIWTTITDFTSAPSWREDVERVELLAPREGRTVFRETTDQGPVLFEVVEMAAPARMVVRVADPDLPFSGAWTYSLAQEGQRTRITIVEDGEVHNPIFRLMSTLFFDHATTLEKYLRALGRRHGEDVVVEVAG